MGATQSEDGEHSSCVWLQDLEVQTNELAEANERLQKEVGLLRNLAKEALLEKKKSQSALEALKHQVVQLLADRQALTVQQEGQTQDASPPASTGGACVLAGFELLYDKQFLLWGPVSPPEIMHSLFVFFAVGLEL